MNPVFCLNWILCTALYTCTLLNLCGFNVLAQNRFYVQAYTPEVGQLRCFPPSLSLIFRPCICAPHSEGPQVREEDEENGLGLPPLASFVYLGQLWCLASCDLLLDVSNYWISLTRQCVFVLLHLVYLSVGYFNKECNLQSAQACLPR